MSKEEHPRKAVENFKAIMQLLSPSRLKLIAFSVSLVVLVGYSVNSEQFTLLKSILLVYSYILGLSVYSLNRLSQVKNDIEYLSQEYFGDFPVRQPNGFAWETPDGQRLESERLNKHYSYRIALMFIGFVLLVFGLCLLTVFV
ncbi:TPA: hypothetical protein NGR42_004789 [Vibrio parahaemolyticus]|uniref:hypothetical protein n=1 Tax=Vibrio parahaemolyticus TaxID=670 RepID=UPI003B67831A|nr:hypothetical protein [Vibrio parahaemolyticus]HCE4480280.1 hypothetical protein [Vibrio parahaemolyticus]